MRRGLIGGIVLWAALSLCFKLIVDGDLVRFDGAGLRLILPIGGAAVAIGLALALRITCPPENALRIGLGFAVSGMILGCAALLAFGRFMAQPSMEHGIVYAVFMLWTYGLLLAAIGLFSDTE